MTMWPDSLPEYPQISGYSEKHQSNVVRSSMDTGPAKIRKRFTAIVEMWHVTMTLTSSQVETLETFYRAYCASSFDWVHPRTQDPATCRFSSRPAYTAQENYFQATFDIEVLP